MERLPVLPAPSLMLAIALGLGLPANQLAATRGSDFSAKAHGDARQVHVVVFDEPALASFRGFDACGKHRPKLAATSPAAIGTAGLDVKSAAAVAYRDELGDLRKPRLNGAARRLEAGGGDEYGVALSRAALSAPQAA